MRKASEAELIPKEYEFLQQRAFNVVSCSRLDLEVAGELCIQPRNDR